MSRFNYLYVGPYAKISLPGETEYHEPDFVESEQRLRCVCNVDLRNSDEPLVYYFIIPWNSKSTIPRINHADSVLGFINVPIDNDIHTCKERFRNDFVGDLQRLSEYYSVNAWIDYGVVHWFN